MPRDIYTPMSKQPVVLDNSTPDDRHRANDSWQKRSLVSIWHPCTQMQRAVQLPPLAIVRGQWPLLFDADGRRYFDATSSWWVNLFGHADARINAALKDQLDHLPHVMLAGCTHVPAVEPAERLSALTDGVFGHCFFASDGASAVEIALKMSFHYWRNCGRDTKREFICLRQGYHGETLGAPAVTDVAVFRDAYDPLLMRSHQVMSPDARQAAPGESAADVARRAARDLETLLEARHAHIAALILEPLVQGAAGMAMHGPSYLRAVRPLRGAPDRRRDRRGLRPHRHLLCVRASVEAGLAQDLARPDLPVQGHQRRLPAALAGSLAPRYLRRLSRRRCGARLSAFAFVLGQRAGLPRGTGGARSL